MLHALSAVFALLTGAAGWFYLFFSKAAQNLADVEERRLNARRIYLRRVGGATMLVLAVLFYVGLHGVSTPGTLAAVWLGVLFALAVVVVLALIDLRLTWKIRTRRLRQQQVPLDRKP